MTALRFGDHITLAIWLSGSETPEMLRLFLTEDATAGLNGKADAEGVRLGPIDFQVKQPGDDRVPPVPEWLGKKLNETGRKPVTLTLKEGVEPQTFMAPVLIVAEAMVVGVKARVRQRGFLADLNVKDLARLREKTKEIWNKAGVGYRGLTDQECDRLIDQHGPDAAYGAVLGSHMTGPIN